MQSPTAIDSASPRVSEKSSRTILLAEDSPVYRRLIGSLLSQWNFEFVVVEDGTSALKRLTEPNAPRVALLDWVLPGVDGVEICRRLRGRPSYEPYTYTILLTAKTRKQERLEAMDAGADDFLAKPFDPSELKAHLLVGKRIIDLQQKLVSANNALQFAACHDFLTGAWNRAEIVAFMQRELARARREGTTVGIVLLDVDHFKTVNDKFGHETGDFVLKEITNRLSASGREYNGVGRYGGEEFLLIIPTCDLNTTMRRANQIRNLIAGTPISTPHGAISVTVSMGVTVSEGLKTSDALLREADIALYQAKRNGRNRVEQSRRENELVTASPLEEHPTH